ncbi:SGT1 protein-domain-containing protein [Coprinopsis sp. MPI-PUGE-AT-0042]|nr:SGT1 protein-domain-containing protein [Coprinopsis sp. MPI-PUGE-AT-0042]
MASLSTISDIFGRTPQIAEDTLQYYIYPPPEHADKASVTTFAACIQSFAQSLLQDQGFIWHRDTFEVKVVPNPDGEKDSWVLEGRMRVGDCVDDEWCVVWLLREVSAKWDLAVNVFDSDGEFLLIEAAEVLPHWVSPSNSENRVWIYKNRLHLIPLDFVSPSSRRRLRRKLPNAGDSDDERDPSSEDDYISANDAQSALRNGHTSARTLAPPEVEKAVWNRIAGYPSALKNHTHTTKAYLPVDVAKALQANPSLVQRAVETFYTRDAIQLRAAHKMARFPPGDDKMVLRPVKMTRTAYAQLVGQKFYPPKVFGRWNEREGQKEWRWRDVGMKIAVGFEMLYKESKKRQNGLGVTAETLKSSSEAVKDSLRNNPEYLTYIENLATTNYFQGEIEGSAKWKELETKAALTFVEVRRADDATRPSFATQVDSAIVQASLDAAFGDVEEDDDSWLNLDVNDFDAMLSKTMGSKNGKMDVDGDQSMFPKDDEETKQAKQLQDLASKVEKFVEGKGDVEGARFDDELLSDEEFSEEEEDSDDESMQGDSDDEEKTTSTLPQQQVPPPTDAERQEAMAKLVAPLEQGEYGKMPASFSQSQRVKPTNLDTEVVEELSTSETINTRSMRPPIIPRDEYEGVVDSDDESDSAPSDDESEEDKPQVVGDIEIDMDLEEEEFLEFSRQALGISDAMWNDIVKDRKERGAFLPKSALNKPTEKGKDKAPATVQPEKPTGAQEERPKPAPLSSNIFDRPPRRPQTGPRPNANPELDSFEAVMKALDDELEKIKSGKSAAPKSSVPTPPSVPASNLKDKAKTKDKGKGKAKAKVSFADIEVDSEGEEEFKDIEAAMEAELKAALEKAEEEGDVDMDGPEGGMDYNMIKNFLESLKSQEGASGPVSNLAGRLQGGWMGGM